MTTVPASVPTLPLPRQGIAGWLLTTDHKRIALLILSTALVFFFVFGAMALTMRSQLALPGMSILSPHVYSEFFTMHGSGMIFLAITPFALGLGVYLVPLQIGSPTIAAPRLLLFCFYLYLFGALGMVSGFLTSHGAADAGWFAYVPLSGSEYSPGKGMDLWIAGTFLAGLGQLIIGGSILWTVMRLRTKGMSLMRMPLFTWSMVGTTLMVIASFPALLAAMSMLTVARFQPGVTASNTFNIAYQDVFWFYGHPVVYVMFFPFVGAILDVVATFSGRRNSGYKWTVIALLAFSTGSMAVWGHHMFTTGQIPNDYFSVVSIFLIVPAGLEYFSIISTLVGGRLVYKTPLLFAIAFLPQFFIGGATGVMLASPTLDYMLHDSYFVVAHFHYTLFGGSVFGFFAGFYYWFPKATGRLLDERLGKTHFWLMVIGTNVTFIPMFFSGFFGMPRRVETYPPTAGLTTTNLISSIGAGILGISMIVLALNIAKSLRHGERAGANPWSAFTLEWATSSPPPPLNFSSPPPYVTSPAPLLDLRERAQLAAVESAGNRAQEMVLAPTRAGEEEDNGE